MDGVGVFVIPAEVDGMGRFKVLWIVLEVGLKGVGVMLEV